MLFVSLGGHLVVFLLFSGVLLPHFKRDVRPVYHVDLVNLPVKDPQAGRPDARPEAPKQKPEPKKPEPVKVAPPEPATKKPETVKVPPPKPEPKKPETPKVVKPAVEKPVAAKEKTNEKISAADEKAVQEKIRQMQARSEREAAKQRIAELAAKDTRQSAIPNAPIGMPEGKGSEAGIAWDLWIRTFLKSNWSLSRYQVSRLDLQAKVSIIYDAGGNLVNYRFLDPSGDNIFDDSVKRAILKEKTLPNKPEERLEIVVIFNLKDLPE
jgi:outer membrane biosynthesis protein TonB